MNNFEMKTTGTESLEDNIVYISNDGTYMAEMTVKNSIKGAAYLEMTPYGIVPIIRPEQTDKVKIGKCFAHGSVSIVDIYSSGKTGEIKAKLCVRPINPTSPCRNLEIRIDELFDADSQLREKIILAGIDLVNNCSYNKILRYLRFVYSEIKNISKKDDGFFMDDNHLLKYTKAEDALLALPDHSTALQIVDFRFCSSGALIPYCVWALDEVRHITGFIPPIMVLISSSPIFATRELAKIMKVQPCTDVSKLDPNRTYERPIICDLSGLSDYKKRLSVRILSQLSANNTIIIIINETKIISNETNDWNTVYIPLSDIKTGDEDAIRAIIVDTFVHSPDLIENLKSCVGVDSNEDVEKSFITALMYIADSVLHRIYDTNDYARELFSEFKKYLINKVDSIETDGKRILREYLDAGNFAVVEKSAIDETLYKSVCSVAYSGTSLYILPAAMKEAAATGNISCERMCADLKKEGILHSTVKNQIKIFSNSFEFRVYEILQDKLYEPFQLRFQTRDLLQKTPQLKICIGEAEGTQLFLSSSECAADDNLNIAIVGTSGSGKTWFMRNLVLEAIANGCLVLTICVKSLRYKTLLPDADTVVLRRAMFYDANYSICDIIDTAINSGEFTEDEGKLLLEARHSTKLVSAGDILSAVEFLKKKLNESSITEQVKNKLDELYEKGIFEAALNFPCLFYSGNVVNFVIDDRDLLNTEEQRSVVDMLIEKVISLKQNGIIDVPLFFMIDEATNFDLSQNSGIVKILLRQGRSLGIATVLAAQSFTAENAKNIKHALNQCGTFVAFDIVNDPDVLRRFGVSSDDKERRKIISERPKYVYLAKGALATETTTVSYPVFGALSEEQRKTVQGIEDVEN